MPALPKGLVWYRKIHACVTLLLSCWVQLLTLLRQLVDLLQAQRPIVALQLGCRQLPVYIRLVAHVPLAYCGSQVFEKRVGQGACPT